MTTSGISAILLAAGFSSRMGRLKALLPWQGKPLISYQIEQMKIAGINEIIIVLGHQADHLRSIVSTYDVTTVFNKDFAHGKSTSIQKGAACIKDDAEGILVSAVDQPVSSQTIRTLSNYLKITKAKVAIPVYQEKRGHPILFHRSIKKDLLEVNEKTKGLRNVIRKYDGHITYVPVNDSHILLNLNSPNEYKDSLQGGVKMRVSEIEMFTPPSIEECLYFLQDNDRSARIIAGGTDAIVRMKDGILLPDIWVNIKQLEDLRYIREESNGIHIGPLTTHTDIVQSKLLQEKADVLVGAAREVGAIQLQNMGTIGGNLGTASPAGDTIPALFVLDAQIELRSFHEKRIIPINEFFTGPGRTVQKKDEMITNIIIQAQAENEIGIFEKLGPRKAQSISIVNVAINLKMGKNPRECLSGKIAFGSVGPTIIRSKKCERMLTLGPLETSAIQDIAGVAWKEVMPISDVRASAKYRRSMATALLERGLYRLMRRWEER